MNFFTKTIKKHPIYSVIIALLVIYLGISIKQHKGPSVRVETDEPASDFVVRCTWSSAGFLHGGGHIIATRIAVINSNETYDCGYSFWAGVQGASSNVGVRHPIYTGQEGKSYNVIDGVRVAKLITLLQKLDEQKAKFEDGYWDKWNDPESEYVKHSGCGAINRFYLADYSKAKKVNKDHFIALYKKPLFECNQKRYEYIKSLSPILSDKIKTAEERMKYQWRSDMWSKYE